MPGYLLVQDAVEARKNVFDEWLDDRRQQAEQVAQAAQEAAARVAQEAALRRDALQSAIAASAPQTPPEPPPAPEPVSAPPPQALQPIPPPTTPEAQQRGDAFDRWENDQIAQRMVRDWLNSAGQAVQPVANQVGNAVGGFVAPIASAAGDILQREQAGLGALARHAQANPLTPLLTPEEATTAANQYGTVETSAVHAVNPLRDVPVLGPTIDQAWNPLLYAGAESVPAVIGALGSVAASNAAEQYVDPGDPNKGLKTLGAGLVGGLAGQGAAGMRVPGAIRDFLTGAESEAGSIAPMVGARIGGAVAGGIAGNATTPDDADPWSRAAHIVGGAAAGFATPGLVGAALHGEPAGIAGQLENLRPYGPAQGPVLNPTGLEKFGTYTTENLISGPASQLWNVITQAVELGRQPAVRALSGREDEAMSGLRSAASAVPDGIQAFNQALMTGRSQAGGRVGVTSAWNPFLRLLGASDDFFKIVGGQMGRGMEARAVLRQAGDPSDAATITSLLQGNADRILASGDRAGRLSVFGEGTSGVGHWLSDTTQRLLRSDNTRDKVYGLLMKAVVPFSGVPEKLWQIGVARAPGIAEANQLRKFGYAVKAGDEEGMRAAVGELATGSVLNTAILAQVANGNVTGPDDPEHPNSVRVGGTWYDYSGWGPMALQFAIPASIVESVQRTGNLPDQSVLNYAGNALNASFKTMVRANVLASALDLAGALSSSDPVSGVGRIATNYVDRLVPKGALLNQMEQMLDEHMREVPRNNPLAREMSRIPGLANLLPTKISPTTGEAQLRQKAGPVGVLLRAETVESDPLRAELARLERKGYTDLPNLETYPDTVSWHGTTIKLRPNEQRAITQQLGKARADLGQIVNDPGYLRTNNDGKAVYLQRALARIDNMRTTAWLDMVDEADAEQRLNASQRVAGRLVNPSPTTEAVATALGGRRPAPAELEAVAPLAQPSRPTPAAPDNALAQMRAYLDSILGQSSAALLQRLTQTQRDELAATLVEEQRRQQQQPVASR